MVASHNNQTCAFIPDGGFPVHGRIVERRCGPCTGDMVWIMETDGGSRFQLESTHGYIPSIGAITGVEYGTLYW